MKLTIDLAQSPAALMNELTQAVRFALGATFYIEESDNEPAFTAAELNNPAVNVPNGLPALPLPTGGALPAASAGATPASVETDSEGQPYDVRIHSAGKSKIANGSWKLKKGVDKALVDQVKAQNAQMLATPLPTATPPLVATGAALPSLPALPAGAGTLPELPPVAPVAAADVEIVVTDYPSFAQFVAQQIVKHGDKAVNELNRGLTHYGLVDQTTAVPQLELMAHRPEMVDAFYKWFKTVLGA